VGLAQEDTTAALPEAPQEPPSAESVEPPPPDNLIDRIADWFWGGVPAAPEPRRHTEREEGVENGDRPAAENRPEHGEDDAEANDHQRNPGMAGDAGEGGVDPNDADAVDDADDLEGVMELIGMQGPIFGLLQNGVFSALLVSFTVAVGIWLPYLWGKIALVFLTNPIRLFVGAPLAILSIVVDVALDSLIGCLGYIVYGVNMILKAVLGPMARGAPLVDKFLKNTSGTSLSLISGSGQRLKRVADGFFSFRESDIPVFSVVSHQALHIHEARFTKIFQISYKLGKLILYDIPLLCIRWAGRQKTDSESPVAITEFARSYLSLRETVLSVFRSPLSTVVNPNLPNPKDTTAGQTTTSFDYDLAHWDTKDRIIAIIVGYVFAFVVGLLYLRIVRFMSQINRGQRFEGVVADVLHQAGGVMKVILIIGIEMIVFPLYCGLLLDVALMPIFENATLASRVAFTFGSPLTSLFVHWFVGTCYMFHFALFVSMCRKVMRSGVLCKSHLPTICKSQVLIICQRFHPRSR
jgi:E3 ubiquitin-protein ligase MARCH6